MYTGTRDLHVPNISKYMIGPFQTTNVEGARFEVKVCLNIHGMISVVSITMLEEEIESPLSAEEPSKSSIKLDTDESVKFSVCQEDVRFSVAEYITDSSGFGTENGPLLEDKSVHLAAAQTDAKGKTPQKKLNVINVPVSVLVYGSMTLLEVHSAMETELVMTRQDRVMEETKDMKNAVEAYVYDMRNKLDSKYHDFVSAEEKKLLRKQLQEVEDWLYEDSEDVTMEVYLAKLEEMKKQGGKVEECYKDWTERELAVQQLNHCIAHYLKLASGDIRRFDHVSTEEKQKVIVTCANLDMWLHKKREQQNLLPKFAVPTLRAADVTRNFEALDRFCRSIMGKPKPPRTEQQSLPRAERQHPLPEVTVKQPDDTAQLTEDTVQQPQGGDLAVDPQPVAYDVEPEANAAPMDIENTVNGTTDPTPKHV